MIRWPSGKRLYFHAIAGVRRGGSEGSEGMGHWFLQILVIAGGHWVFGALALEVIESVRKT
jgi:hypothetical protein